MDASVEAYRKRRQQRLDAHGDDTILRYHRRRQKRLDLREKSIRTAKWSNNLFDFDSLKQDTDRDDDWITMNGSPVLVGEDDVIMGGAGGKFTGEKLSDLGDDSPEAEPRGNLGKMDYEQRIAVVQRELGVTTEEANTYCNDLRKWSESGYESIRKYQQGETKDPEARRLTESVEDYIENAPRWDGDVISRGISVSRMDGNLILKELERKINTGESIGMCGTSSWSEDEKVARQFLGEGSGKISILFHAEGELTATGIQHLSKYPREKEVAMSVSQRLTPVSIEKDEGKSDTWVVWLVSEGW